jgi:hypothetical protein
MLGCRTELSYEGFRLSVEHHPLACGTRGPLALLGSAWLCPTYPRRRIIVCTTKERAKINAMEDDPVNGRDF